MKTNTASVAGHSTITIKQIKQKKNQQETISQKIIKKTIINLLSQNLYNFGLVLLNN